MMHPYPKHDYILNRDLLPRERLEPALSALRWTKQLIEQAMDTVSNASDRLTDNQLEIICSACVQAHNAAENIAFMGISGFNAHPLKMVEWEEV